MLRRSRWLGYPGPGPTLRGVLGSSTVAAAAEGAKARAAEAKGKVADASLKASLKAKETVTDVGLKAGLKAREKVAEVRTALGRHEALPVYAAVSQSVVTLQQSTLDTIAGVASRAEAAAAEVAAKADRDVAEAEARRPPPLTFAAALDEQCEAKAERIVEAAARAYRLKKEAARLLRARAAEGAAPGPVVPLVDAPAAAPAAAAASNPQPFLGAGPQFRWASSRRYPKAEPLRRAPPSVAAATVGVSPFLRTWSQQWAPQGSGEDATVPERPAPAVDAAAPPGVVLEQRETTQGVRWTDVRQDPAADAETYQEGIAAVLRGHGVHDTLVEDAMERVLMPQAVMIDDCACLILRCVIPDQPPAVDTLQGLTSRLTVLLFPGVVITLHRPDLAAVKAVRDKFAARYTDATQYQLLNALVRGSVRTYHAELAQSVLAFDALEARLFAPQKERSTLAHKMYLIKRRAAVCTRALAMSQEAYGHTAAFLQVRPSDVYYQDVMQHLAHVRHMSEELNDNAHNVLQLLFQLSSYQLNELMRVLTMFSAFFIPLSFIAGVYGMNFDEMPLIHNEHGALYCLAFMAAVGAGLLAYFRWRGF